MTTSLPSTSLLHIPPLKGEENLEEWNFMLRKTLEYNDLLKYIETSIPEPVAVAEKPQWRKERVAIGMIIGVTITNVYKQLIASGWDSNESNPKVTYDKIMTAIPKVSELTIVQMAEEIGCIRRKNFESFIKFHDRLQYLKRRLGAYLQDDMAILLSFVVIKEEYNLEYRTWSRDWKEKRLTWSKLMEEFLALAGSEKADTSFAALNKNSKFITTSLNTDSKKKYCVMCDRKVSKTVNHCIECNTCYPGKVCWKKHPEQVPDTWNGKKKALKE
ncbi:hypothetical protein F5884DRAFT_759654 [Xylogone sp. PMI_703]|nr:hypothetical protein F5884DRAFT_759654 [Xylogone sp. PMI_703]